MKTTTRTLTRFFLLIALALPAAALAVVPGTGFDGMTPGQYGVPGVVIGDASRVQVVPAGDLGGSAPPNAFGNVLCIDNRGGSGVIILSFTFNCGDPFPEGICKVEYDFFFESWQPLAYVGVYTDDDGSYTNPDDWFQPPVGFPPSTSWGDNAEGERDCQAGHTIDFIISPGAVAYLDNFTTECLEPIANETADWGTLKSMYR
ncbi:hypothetical protein H8E07_14270 [bacterium]|nr:hypothetical protein [bacterium]